MPPLPEIPVEAHIAGLERRWTAAFQRKDVAEMQRYLAEGYALIIAVQGAPLQIVPRNAWFESLEDYAIEEAAIDQIYISVYGDVAVVDMLWRQKASLRGADRSAQFNLTDIWVKQDDDWLLAERHSSRPEHPGTARPLAFPLECELCE